MIENARMSPELKDAIAREEAWKVLQRIADAHQPSRASATPGYLEEFRSKFERVVESLEVGMTADLESRGPSDDMMHEWSLFIAQGRDFLAALAAEIERAG